MDGLCKKSLSLFSFRAADKPTQEQNHRVIDLSNDTAGDRKDTCPNHVGNDKNDGGDRTDRPFQIVIIRMISHRNPRYGETSEGEKG
jgi:hypothetical protein